MKLGCGPSCSCGGKCGGSAAMGAYPVATFDPLNVAAQFIPGGEIGQAVFRTAVGVTTPVSTEDQEAFARLIQEWGQLQRDVILNPGADPTARQRANALAAEYGAFVRAWNAAQRDPNELRQLLAAVEAVNRMSAAAVPSPRLNIPARPHSGWKRTAAVVGGGALVLTGAALLAAKVL